MKKATQGRPYYHKRIEILQGTAIIIQCGSPRQAAIHGTIPVKMIGDQYTGYVDYIEFEHKPTSGKKSRENFEKSLTKHWEKVDAALLKYPNSTSLNRTRKTSQIIHLPK